MEKRFKINTEGLLGNPDILNTSIGINMIDDLSKADPEKACTCMMSAYGKATDEELRKIGENRRGLCWTLSRLCFNEGTFDKAAYLMLRFAETEREVELGHARLGLQKLFFPRLGATEANLKKRVDFIEKWLCKAENVFISLKVLECAVSFQAAFFYDGTDKLNDRDMKPYTPTVDEVMEYESFALGVISKFADSDKEEVKEKAIEIVGSHFVEHCRYGLAEVAMPVIEHACEIKGNRWDALLDSLLLFKDEMEQDLSEELYRRYTRLIQNLSRNDFEFRFKRVEKELYNSSYRLSTEKLMGEQRTRYKALAEEFVIHKLFTKELLAKLYETEVISTSPFGEFVARGLTEGQRSEFIADSIDILNGREKSQTDILVDFTVVIGDEEFDVDFRKLLQLKNKRPLFAAVARRSDSFNNKYMDVLLGLVKNEEAPAEYMVSFWSSFRFAKMEDGDMATWMMRVKELQGGEQTVLHILQSAINGETYNKNFKTVEVALDTVMKMKVDYSGIMGYYQYWNVVRLLLMKGNYPELARHINCVLLGYVKTQDDFLINNYEVKQSYRLLLGKYFDVVWADLSKALLSDGEEYWTYHRLKDIMGSMIGGAYNEIGLLFENDYTEALMEWCKQNPYVAPERLMDMAPVFEGDAFSKIVYMLVDEFGKNVKVMNALGHNLGCFGWVGSVIPLYQKELRAVETLKEHKYEEVRVWSARMAEYLKGEMEKEGKSGL